MCQTAYNDTYCCQVGSTDGKNEYQSDVPGTCQLVTTVSDNQEAGDPVTCGAQEEIVGVLTLLAVLLGL
eukprot:CAMPEP_0202960216 /NCGR_PEP_ID=MMETSP1396-20130829/4362_1 /ASSEMBLY_ACC=CAM_ASM_000872 /TAXON_ID= /ORGANISM="Pseudokeronopsis sp., Strain Brazil" /LENGTH=68 /DNA_ID=CAMNT_0049679279 /DNA_START=340 /DNA_END=546 /DNA_ORIENTATION=-